MRSRRTPRLPATAAGGGEAAGLAAGGGAGAAGVGGAAGFARPSATSSTSAFVTRPPGPVPAIEPTSMPLSAAIFLATEVALPPSAAAGASEALEAGLGGVADAAAGDAGAAPPAGFAASGSI